MTLSVNATVRRGTFTLSARLEVGEECLVVRGPNGSGKSTLLMLVAGLAPSHTGVVRIDNEVVDSGVSGRDAVFVLPEDRHVGYLPQGGALFPHMSAVDNVAYGLRARGAGASSARADAVRILEAFDIADLAGRMPHSLSGGQKQRVAIARTLVTRPRALLFDEPMSALDDQGREDVIALVNTVRTTFTGPILLVSHDARDTEALGGREVRVGVKRSGGGLLATVSD